MEKCNLFLKNVIINLWKNELGKHFQSVHEGKKQHNCYKCNAIFVKKIDFDYHFTSVHGGRHIYETCSTCFLNHILCLYTCSKCLLLQITLHWKIILHLFMKGKSNINVTIVVLLLIIFLSWNIILHLFMKEKSNIIVIDVVLILRNRLTLKIILLQSLKVKRLILKIR